MFIRLTENRKDRDTGQQAYFPLIININAITHIQPPTANGRHTYIGLGGERFAFVKESLDDIEKMINK